MMFSGPIRSPKKHVKPLLIFESCACVFTRENQVQKDGASSVPDTADGGKVNVQDYETDTAQETGHAHGDAIVTGISVVVEHT